MFALGLNKSDCFSTGVKVTFTQIEIKSSYTYVLTTSLLHVHYSVVDIQERRRLM